MLVKNNNKCCIDIIKLTNNLRKRKIKKRTHIMWRSSRKKNYYFLCSIISESFAKKKYCPKKLIYFTLNTILITFF